MNRARFGLEEKHLKTLNELLVQPLREAGCIISIFGSRARGDNHLFSDIDVLVEGDIPHSKLSAIKEQLEESSLPIRVDIVLWHDLAETYRAGVMRDSVLF
jgi:predicted nucleotidyltransferase